MSDTTDEPPAGPRIEVVAGGTPDDAELVALTLALTPVAGEAPPSDTHATPAWARAALLEGVGHRRPSRPSDLDTVTRFG